RHVAPVRRELRMPTIMNVLGPLTNPAGARRQVVGVADPALLELIAGALLELGHIHALVVHGEPGLDEVSPIGTTRVLDVHDGRITEQSIDFRGLLADREPDLAALAGGDPADNARIVLEVLQGTAPEIARAAVTLNAAAAISVAGNAGSLAAQRGGPPAHDARIALEALQGTAPETARAAVTLNAAAAIYAAGNAGSIADGVAAAEKSIDSGAALAALERLREASASAERAR